MVGKREKRFCPKNVRLALLKLRILGLNEPVVWEPHPGRYVYYSNSHTETQREYWHLVLDVLREYEAMTNAAKWRERNAQKPA